MAHYAVHAAQLVWLGQSENVTFRVETPREDETFLLRLHTPLSSAHDTIWQADIWQTRDVIQSELLWLEALGRDTALVVQAPVRNRTAQLVTGVVAGAAHAPCNCTLLRWIKGHPLPLTTQRTAQQARALGRLLAQLHQHARHWVLPAGFVRPTYHWDRLPLARQTLQAAGCHGVISTADCAVVEAVVQRLDSVMTALESTRGTWHLIHADLHEDNYLWYEEEARPIDFSRCGFGHPLHDLGESLRHLHPEGRQALVWGYQDVCPLPEAYEQLVEAFWLRAVIENLAVNVAKPHEQAWVARVMPAVVARYFQKYLGGEPFLFRI